MIRRPPRSPLFPYPPLSRSVFVDQTQRGRLGGESRAADRDVALPRLSSQPLDLLRQAAGGQAGIALHRRQRGGEHHRSEEHTSELQSRLHLVCRLLLEKKKT